MLMTGEVEVKNPFPNSNKLFCNGLWMNKQVRKSELKSWIQRMGFAFIMFLYENYSGKNSKSNQLSDV